MCGYTCNGGYSPCAGACVDEQNDKNNCNACGNVCPSATNGQTECVGGMCNVVCNMGLSYCPANAACNDLQNDPNNCNTCDNVCPAGPANSTTDCKAGACGWTCDPTYSQCPDSTCDQVQTDPTHCGSACTNCTVTNPPPSNGTDVCTSGTCDFNCTTGYTKCAAQWSCLAPPVVNAAYVSAGSGFTVGCGSAALPCERLSDGLTFAETYGYTDLYLAHGSYTELSSPAHVAPAGALTIHTGWAYSGGTWTPDCVKSAASTTISAVAGSSVALYVDSGQVTFEPVTITNGSTAAASQSLYGLFVGQNGTSASVTLQSPVIDVAAGGCGTNGTNSTVNSVLLSGGAGTSAAGTNASIGSANPGTYSPALGFVAGNGGNGGVATPATDGSNGTAAPIVGQSGGPSCVSKVSCMEVASSCQPSTTNSCGTAGAYGLGTTAAGSGSGANGGGASIGVLVVAPSTLSITGGSITTGNGGTGGKGGAPGTQLAPPALNQPNGPHAGNNGPSVCIQDSNCGSAPTCTLSCAKFGMGGAGSAGGLGGEGGAGAQGGGGAGGDSHCYATVNGASATLTSVTCNTGAPGTGGAPNGPSGSNAVHN
jgi:hypothetical protein